MKQIYHCLRAVGKLHDSGLASSLSCQKPCVSQHPYSSLLVLSMTTLDLTRPIGPSQAGSRTKPRVLAVALSTIQQQNHVL